ncbi:MAG: DnaJ domain-containing protein [Bacteroidetes bacterium]|nr:DnaJ domain-containing protein [Bacteroidota bacterium]
MTDVKNFELSKIIIRLQMIKSLIALEEENEIAVHISRLRQFSLDGEIENIISLLEGKSYSKAMPAIEAFINHHNQVGFYIDSELEGLKLEAKVLETEVNKLSNEKADLEKLIHDFGLRHNNELGELILKILRFRKSKAKGTPKEAETEKDFNEYSKEYEISKDERINDLTEDEQKELKQKYRKASKLCHPDVVSEEQKELADKLFAELNAAYARNDLKRVIEILENLEKGNFFVSKSDSINEKQLLKTEIEKLRLRIKELKVQVQSIKESDAFTTLSSISDWDTYFKETRQKLADKIKELEDARE